jgi:peroxiredoxin Q/BCP
LGAKSISRTIARKRAPTRRFRLKTLFTLLLPILISFPAIAGETPAVGEPAPGFKLQDQYGEWHDLQDYRGTWLAVYFYPKDQTPGCTTEACNFRDNIFAFKAIGAEVVGISLDDVDSHKEFSDKYKLPFVILADEGGAVADSYGVLRDYKLIKGEYDSTADFCCTGNSCTGSDFGIGADLESRQLAVRHCIATVDPGRHRLFSTQTHHSQTVSGGGSFPLFV